MSLSVQADFAEIWCVNLPVEKMKQFSAYKYMRVSHLIHNNQKNCIFNARDYSYRQLFKQTTWSFDGLSFKPQL